MSVQLFVPANFVSAGWGTPTVCARHGEPAVVRERIRLVSPVSGWLFLLSPLIYYIVVAATRKTVWAPQWPLCVRCKKEQLTYSAAGGAVLLVGLGLWVLCVQVPDTWARVGAGIGFLAFVGGIIVARRGSRAVIVGGVVSDDGQAVRFADAHEAFARQAVAAQQVAMQHYAAGPPLPPVAAHG
ncbi:hypothetical protein ACWKSP_35055 [Micromonosporaceae bacterium Da 78-11]